MSVKDWPYKLADYPEGYREHMVLHHGKSALSILAEMEMKPDECPVEVLIMDERKAITFAPHHAPKHEKMHYLGVAFEEIDLMPDGRLKLYHEPKGSPDNTAQMMEKIEWCRKMCVDSFHIISSQVEHKVMYRYYLLLSSKQDQMAWELAWKATD